MQSYTTQAHQRNYQGHVILQNRISERRKKHGLAVGILAFLVALTSSLLGVMALHNQQLKHRIHALETQSVAAIAPQATKQTRRGKTLPNIPISEQQHETEDLPTLKN
ncbi:MAG: hypothetical protein KIG16_03990 [Eubacteriales bacterium]|nr:hypothetical protein [Eubacteriales bacterium]